MNPCPRCGQPNRPEADHCERCAARLHPLPPLAEAEYIGYLLSECEQWPRRGWMYAYQLSAMREAYARRRYALLHPGEAAPQARAAAPRPAAQPIRPPAPKAAPPPDAPSAAQKAWPWIAEFLEAHWLKLLTLLAAVFILVGMRQILGWRWVSDLAVRLIPLLPIGLSTGFLYAATRAEMPREIGPTGSGLVGATLSAFALFSVNKHWLGGALPPSTALAAGAGLATAVAGALYARLKLAADLHLALAGLGATLYCTLQAVLPSGLGESRHLLPYGVAFALLALVLLAAARFTRDARPADERAALETWAHVWTVGVVAWGLLPAVTDATVPADTAGLLAAAALLSLAGAQWSADPRQTYSAAALSAASAAIALRGTGSLWYPYATVALLLGLLASGLAAINRRLSAHSPIAAAYGRISEVAASAAGLTLCVRCVASAAGEAAPLAASDWPLGGLLALALSFVYAAQSGRGTRAGALYASAAAGGFAVALAANRLWEHVAFPQPHTPAHDLLPAATALLVAAFVARWAFGAKKTAGEQMPDPALPYHHAAQLAAVSALALAVSHGITTGLSTGLWWAIAPCAILALVATAVPVDSLLVRQSWAGIAATAGLACAAFGGIAALSSPLWNQTHAAGLGLALAAWFALAITILVRRREGYAVWQPALDGGLYLGALLASMLAVGGSDSAVWPMTAVFALSLGAFALRGYAEEASPLEGFTLVPLIVGAFRLAAVAQQSGVLGALATLAIQALALTAAVLLLPAVQRQRPSALWLLAGAMTTSAISGALFGTGDEPLRRVASIAAGVGSGAFAALLAFAASQRQRIEAGYGAGLFALAAYLRLGSLAAHVPVAWAGLALAPAAALLGIAALFASAEQPLAEPLRRVAALTAWGGAVYAVLNAVDASEATPAAVTLLCYALLFAAGSIGPSADSGALGGSSAVVLTLGWYFACMLPSHGRTEAQVWSLVAATSALCAAQLFRLAKRLEQPLFASAATIAATAAWMAVVARLAHVPSIWWSMAALPPLAALYVVGHRLRGEADRSLGSPMRATAVALSLLGIGAALFYGTDDRIRTAGIVAGTLSAYGVAYSAGVALRRTPLWSGLAAGAFTLAAGWQLGALGLTDAHWAVAIAAWGALAVAAAWAVERRAGKPLALPVYGAAALSAAAGSLTALAVAAEPGRGIAALVALAISGAVFTGLRFGAGSLVWSHAGFGCFFAAWSLFLYDRLHAYDAGVLDLYLIPLGLYLLLIAHAAGSKASHSASAWLWWMGLLTILTPTYAAFYTHYDLAGEHARNAAAYHALLLAVECMAAVAWGIAHRIRAFVFCGALFALAFAARLGAGAVQEVWSGVVALSLGVALLTLVFYVSVHQEGIRRWIHRMGDEWRLWR